MAVLSAEGGVLLWQRDTEKIRIEPWGRDGLRVRVTQNGEMELGELGALLPRPETPIAATELLETAPPNFAQDAARLGQGEYHTAERPQKKPNALRIQNGEIAAEIDRHGYLRFLNAKTGAELLREYVRDRSDLSEFSVPLNVKARNFRPVPGGNFEISMSFEAYAGEQFYGLGQYQEDFTNMKGATLELLHRNSQASIPFLSSSRGYGFLWNNPAVGQLTLGENITFWTAERGRQIDYWICAGSSPAAILEKYTAVTGRPPMMDEDLMGFWQCKLRYQTQDELLSVAREYQRRGVRLDVIVVDFFHWTAQGDWKFDPRDFPDPEGMVKELSRMGIRLMVSLWPTVDNRSENYGPMKERGYLLHRDRGSEILATWMGPTTYYDALNPGARDYVWQKAKQNYWSQGIRLFWLDEAEPEIDYDELDNVRYHKGPALACANEYPLRYLQGFYEGMRAEGVQNPLSLIRCAWAGSQRYGALLWSGDVESSFKAMRKQLAAGLSAGMAGIPWWTCDIGGFLGGFTESPEFQELLLRWFAWGCFLPVMRLHGDRLPYADPPQGYYGQIKRFGSGAGNEIWSFGEKNEAVLRKYIELRQKLRPYIKDLMQEAHEKGSPVMRMMHYAFPGDENAWGLSDQYMFGPDLLVAPVFEAGVSEREVYLPRGESWLELATGRAFTGGQRVKATAPIDVIPLFVRAGAKLRMA
ncbi:MAG: family 31 glucosidase [Christensenellaceae bacterium]|jgi:alpha-D-xyloside xylohydrolase|nr:family 31 glucosidase [Christensenellaceae bacterium]